jgi:hypothetical protein
MTKHAINAFLAPDVHQRRLAFARSWAPAKGGSRLKSEPIGPRAIWLPGPRCGGVAPGPSCPVSAGHFVPTPPFNSAGEQTKATRAG